MALTPEQQRDADALYLERLGEWDEGRVWLDGAWFDVESYSTHCDADGHPDGREIALLRRMDPQPSSLLAGQQDGEEGGGRLSEEERAWVEGIRRDEEGGFLTLGMAHDGLCRLLAIIDRLAPAPADGTGGE